MLQPCFTAGQGLTMLTSWAKSCRLLLIPLWAAVSTPTCLAQAPLGTNLDQVQDYSPQLPFRDLFLSSREWFTQCDSERDPGCTDSTAFNTEEAALLDLDASGWVRTVPTRSAAPIFTSVATFWDIDASFPAGRYIVLYQGDGSIEYGLAARKNSSLSRPGRDVVEVAPSRGGILLRITATDPQQTGNYIRDIHFVSETDESTFITNRFSNAFLQQIQPYQALRFMDWLRTNNSEVSSWEDRAKITDARLSTARGVAPEVLIEISNATNKTPWITIPHRATDGYVESFATLAKSLLRSDLSLYLEYSNEAWNSTFSQGTWMEQQGSVLFAASNESGFTKRINFYGKRTAEICEIWRRVFSDSPQRVICVMASQAANAWTATEALACPLSAQGPCVQRGIGALAIAPYFGDYLGQDEAYQAIERLAGNRSTALNALFSEINSGGALSGGPSGGALQQSFSWIEDNRRVASDNNLSLLAYEGGQHLVGIGAASNSQSLTDIFIAANRDERIGTTYTNYLEGWRSRGGDLFVHFSDISLYTKFGSWGALENSEQLSSPKYDALVTYATGSASRNTPGSKQSTLSVRVSGRGIVTSRPAGIQCGVTCLASFSRGSRVTLTARPIRGNRFSHWSGACQHRQSRCRVTMTRARRVRAVFVPR